MKVVQKVLGKLQIPPGEGPGAVSMGMPSWHKHSPVQAAGEDRSACAKSLLGLQQLPFHRAPYGASGHPSLTSAVGHRQDPGELRGSRRASGKRSLGAGGFKGAPAPTPGRAAPGGMCPAPSEECNTCELLFRQPRPRPPPLLPLPPQKPI